ncbi:MAG: adenosylmethionine--8-amino-7-oxononanoate transaminase [Hydrogenibacillus schlegelii]|uniref:Adenosylmethionine-8-amino-7-oxononanoate aminotransferase n=1 Tax=Hydrogenibacillus schlegelii TaxID=1484 RepID=A0A947CX72_HYDSH|nr:adenosylmethionine--8-amino-7-oxononanoate transaminase [Hydrogenibacillus schlegelii]
MGMTRRVPPRDVLLAWNRDHLWNPFTPMKNYLEEDPVIIERGEGVKLFDVDGRAYWDGYSSLWLNVHGHNVPELNAAVTEQLGKIAHATLLGSANVPAILLAKRLADLAPPGLRKVFFSDSGAEAVEIAVKMAFQYWQNIGRPEKRRFITMTGAYHGDTIGAVSVGAIELFHARFGPLLFPTVRIPYPHAYRHPSGDPEAAARDSLAALESILRDQADEIAALIVEPVMQGAAGMIRMPDGFMAALADRLRAYDVLLIADEVATGLGRTGAMFAVEHDGVVPDFLTLGKGLTGGYLPVAATLTTDRIYEAFWGEEIEGKTFYHGHSYTGNPLGCAVALANLELMEKRKLLEHVRRLSARAEARLSAFRELPYVGDVRQAGLMIGIEIVRDRATKAPFPPEVRIGRKIVARARELGLLTRPLGDVIVFMPPLATPEAALEAMMDILYRAIAEVTEKEAGR